MLQKNYDLNYALNHYTLLTIGDGLVSQIPALLISTATGIIVTRATSEENLGSDLTKQLFNSPKVLLITGGVLLLFAFVPGLPFIPFFFLGAIFGGLGYMLIGQQRQLNLEITQEHEKAQITKLKVRSDLQLLQVDQLNK